MKKTIVITGASRGIGKAIAIELAGKDTNIVINCVNNVDKLNEVKSIIEEKGSVCETFIGDMGNYSDVQKMFDMCLQRFGQVDVLINNAGISVFGLFQDMGENEWHRICNTNIDSVFNCCHFAVKDRMNYSLTLSAGLVSRSFAKLAMIAVLFFRCWDMAARVAASSLE